MGSATAELEENKHEGKSMVDLFDELGREDNQLQEKRPVGTFAASGGLGAQTRGAGLGVREALRWVKGRESACDLGCDGPRGH